MRAPELTIGRARKLRRAMSLPEVLLWRALRKRQPGGLRFRRQHPIGPYILDFYCPAARLALEVDGLAHDGADRLRRDRQRDAWLAGREVKVLHIVAADLLRTDGLEAVITALKEAAAAPSGSLRSPPPPLCGGGSASEQIAQI